MSQEKEHLLELIKEFKNAMLVTRGQDDMLRARPLHIASEPKIDELWFVTAKSTSQVEDISNDIRVAITMQSSTRQICLSGVASVVTDRSKFEALWSPSMRAWFPKGVEDPNIVAIRFVPIAGEYWDASGLRGLKVVFESVKAILKGERVEIDGTEHHGEVGL